MERSYGRKTMLCVWWDQKGVIYYELLKPGETVNIERYRQQMINLNQALCESDQNIKKGNTKWFLFMIMHHHTQQNWSRKRLRHLVGKYFRMRLTHQMALFDYHLFASMGHALAQQRFTSYEDVRKWLDDWFDSKEQQFFWCGIHKLSNRWKKCIATNGQYFE